MLHAILAVTVLLAIGLALRANLRVLRVLYIPASVVAGVLGFAIAQALLHVPVTTGAVGEVRATLSGWPTTLIAAVFAGLLLERPAGRSFGESLRRGARSGALAWIIILGQIALGLIVYALFVRPTNPKVPAAFGQLLEVSWAGGHGSSAAMGRVYDGLGFPEGQHLAFFLGTVGLIYGVTSGLVLVNLAVRRGWTAAILRTRDAGAATSNAPALAPDDRPPAPPSPPTPVAEPLVTSRFPLSVIGPLTLQAVILLTAFGVGCALQQAFVWGATSVVGATDPAVARGIDSIPLFLFTLLGGWVVRRAMQLLRCDDLIDPPALQRLQGLAMDVLIVAAITTLRVDALRTFFLPVVLLILLGGAWATACLLLIAPRLLPRAYWFELGLLNYGFSTANTPQGLMLLRIVDPELKSGAAEDYAVAAPLSAPFVGGGILTVAVFPVVLQSVSPWVAVGVLVLAVIVLYAVGRSFRDRN